MGLFSKSKTPIIGIDLGSGYIKIAQFEKKGNDLKLVNFGVLDTPEGAIVEGRIEKPEEVREVIKQLLSIYSFIGNRVATNVSGKLVTVKELIMDDLPPQELHEAIKWEVEKILPAPIDKMAFDYQVLSKVKEGNTEKLYILFAAAPIEVVETTVQLFKSLNLDLVSIEVEAFSVLRLLRFLGEFAKNSERVIAAINIGHNFTSINMVDKGLVRFSRIIPWGGKRLTDKIAYYFGIDSKDAENKKREELDLSQKDAQVFKAVEEDLNELSLEIRRSISYYFAKYNEGKVSEVTIILEGGTANTKNIDQYLEETTGFPSVVNRLFSDIAKYDPNLFTKEYLYEMAPMFAVATGLALKEHQVVRKKEKAKKK
ncbi:type IV pilus assembly protein PilM [Caldisericum exile]|uniref:Type IV pilus assembly protein PilM n=1 Tax=Caldisericum exile (strain DSM 21853 / NBRC 104410 / AZM16c01) TaxID=511051 RepID=A0A7U6GF16_CALEA|nr:type IV pilus assembly protein PilM [Caldisericum exile]BAL81190.1 putative type IV pilus assembly protein PilM [Caldisericum exile AZM16c01]